MKYVALFSHSQQCFHIEPVEVMLKNNIRSMAVRLPIDYIPVGFGTRDECGSVVDMLKKKLQERAA
jgi:hypothetical protein